MLPLLPFTLGILTGAAAIKLVRSNKAKAGLQRAQASIREATVSSLAVIETTSARARDKLAIVPATEAPAPVVALVTKAPAKREAKPRARKPAAKKTVAKPTVETSGS